MLSVRLHGAITAYLCGVPFALLEYHRKCTDFLEDIGQAEELRIGSKGADACTVTNLLQRLSEHPPTPSLPSSHYSRDAAASFTSAPWYSPTSQL